MASRDEYVELQRRCIAILRNLGIKRSLSFEAVRARVEERRGRPLVFKELPTHVAAGGVCGLWLGTDDADYIFYEVQTTALHREHIILHELAHVLCDHMGVTELSGRSADNLFGDLQSHLVKRLMARTSYTTAEEQEAEMIASLIQSAMSTGQSGGFLGRLGAFLGVTSDDDRE